MVDVIDFISALKNMRDLKGAVPAYHDQKAAAMSPRKKIRSLSGAVPKFDPSSGCFAESSGGLLLFKNLR